MGAFIDQKGDHPLGSDGAFRYENIYDKLPIRVSAKWFVR